METNKVGGLPDEFTPPDVGQFAPRLNRRAEHCDVDGQSRINSLVQSRLGTACQQCSRRRPIDKANSIKRN